MGEAALMLWESGRKLKKVKLCGLDYEVHERSWGLVLAYT
jgi:hypothetical protein